MFGIDLRKKPGFTLLELLISVAIFSGLVILILGTFVRSTSSSAKVSELRDKSAAARLLMSQLSTEFRYLYLNRSYKDNANSGFKFKGFYFTNNGNSLIQVIRYPNGGEVDGQPAMIRREYKVVPLAGAKSANLILIENRTCKILPPEGEGDPNGQNNLSCQGNSQESKFLPEQYVLDYVPLSEPVFSGLLAATNNDPTKPTGYLTVQVAIKPASYRTKLCSELAKGTCFKVRTTFALEDKI